MSTTNSFRKCVGKFVGGGVGINKNHRDKYDDLLKVKYVLLYYKPIASLLPFLKHNFKGQENIWVLFLAVLLLLCVKIILMLYHLPLKKTSSLLCLLAHSTNSTVKVVIF